MELIGKSIEYQVVQSPWENALQTWFILVFTRVLEYLYWQPVKYLNNYLSPIPRTWILDLFSNECK